MHIAARRGDSGIAASVLEKATLEGEDSIVNAPSSDRCTPLYIAAKFGHTRIMELLLNKYVNHFIAKICHAKVAICDAVQLLLAVVLLWMLKQLHTSHHFLQQFAILTPDLWNFCSGMEPMFL